MRITHNGIIHTSRGTIAELRGHTVDQKCASTKLHMITVLRFESDNIKEKIIIRPIGLRLHISFCSTFSMHVNFNEQDHRSKVSE